MATAINHRFSHARISRDRFDAGISKTVSSKFFNGCIENLSLGCCRIAGTSDILG
jgi:hypothetical protein